ncbi:hypothetical protein [Sphaerisporangium album]|nr:hypothetical protein [Sphaerisporangium album]
MVAFLVCVAVVTLAVTIYNIQTGTPMTRREGGLYTPRGVPRSWLMGVDRGDGTHEVKPLTGTWYQARVWAERESRRMGTVRAWVRSEPDKKHRYRVWDWRNGVLDARRRSYAWELLDHQLTAKERARLDAEAQRLSEGRGDAGE